MARVLYVHSRRNTFTAIDREALSERYEVVNYFQPRLRVRPVELFRKLRRADVVFGWFASWHTFAALTLARLMRKPSVLVIGGFDVANMPEIGYGAQRGGPRRWMTRWTIKMASRLITNSRYSLREIEQNLGLGPDRVKLVYHGIPDRFGDGPGERKEALALTVGVVYRANLERKGHAAFVAAARLVPEVEFVLAGKWQDDAADELRATAPPNVALTGFISDAELDALFQRARAYVQASQHEGFGLAVAEAMLARAVPVVTDAGALLEVVGDTGVVIESADPEHVAAGVREALDLGPDAGERARARVLAEFSYEMRRDGICDAVAQALAA
jgi:glycosyltransferase involved in cell wall biosynthesis